MEPQYNHQKYEAHIYKKWEESKAFEPRGKGKPFTIIMPPPNANDPLHIGHAREMATQDILIRYHRMKGQPTLWLPGADHAGIETQFVFEKKLAKEDKSRFDFDRATLYQMIWDYVQGNTKVMKTQIRQLGASCDWTRFTFTLDPKIIGIVYKTFKKLYDEGLIYRGERIVNFCPRCGTAYSQLEVDSVERDDNLYYLDYGTVTIATTRPETIFADVAVAVNPKDAKYFKLAGKTAKIPLINREIPVITDILVDTTFGTGALKITPAHDATDFEIGQSHKLPSISVIDEKGRMTATPEKYIGMKAEAARAEVVKDLESAGKIKKVEKIHHLVGICYKDKGLIEPMVSKQWYIKVEPLVKPALEAILQREIKFSAKKFEKIAIHWLRNLKDWNISRQIVWGIRIPAWRCEKCLEWTVTEESEPENCASCGNATLTQDSDTFDTWFSSSQWPFATLQSAGGADFQKFYPTSVMDPAYDILPFWVIRMMMLGLYVTKNVPFETVLLHGLVRDKHGVKISKSKGNVIDPIEMVNKYGSDSLRIASIWGSLVENDSSLSEENINAQRKFCNKVWNAARFVSEFNGEAAKNEEFGLRVKKIINETAKHLNKYKLNQAAELLYSEFWHWYCDVAIEQAKKGELGSKDLKWGLETFLKLLHPFMPFLTEQIWSETGGKGLLINSDWPKA
ncbi:MAG TPA: valine--tRNA ligase [Patescibacteria group bacterium]|nr:valine--tRNA ligase [Patescibacteria group bacterium]